MIDLPDDIKNRFTALGQMSRPLGQQRIEALLRECTIRLSAEVLDQLEQQIRSELAAKEHSCRNAPRGFASAAAVLPEV